MAAATVCRQKAQNKGKTSEEVDSGDLKGCVAHFQACGWDASDFDDRSAESDVFRNELGKPSPLGGVGQGKPVLLCVTCSCWLGLTAALHVGQSLTWGTGRSLRCLILSGAALC